MDEPMEKCDNCLKMFPESKMATHFGYCRRNIRKCGECGEMYDINCEEDHQEEFHKKIPCEYCKNTFQGPELKKHREMCEMKSKYCEYCELSIPVAEYAKHLKACEARTKKCEKCKKDVMNKEYYSHLATCEGVKQQPNQYEHFLKMQREKMMKKEEEARRKEKERERRLQDRAKPKSKLLDDRYKYSHRLHNEPNPKREEKPIIPEGRVPEKREPKKEIKKQEKINWEEEYAQGMGFEYEEHLPNEIPRRNVVPPSYYQPEEPYVPQHNYVPEHHYVPQQPAQNFNMDEDQGFQKALLESIGQKPQEPSDHMDIPSQLLSEDSMNQSFYRDIDLERQKAIMRDIENKKKK